MKHIQSVDTFKLVAIIAVIALHTSPFRAVLLNGSELYKHLDVIITQLARFAVPFFFTISGYFWGAKIRNGNSLIITSVQMGKRVILIFSTWSVIYLFPFNLSIFNEYGALGIIKSTYVNICSLLHHPFILITQGTKVHLWFLLSLLYALIITTVFVYKKWTKSLILISLLLYITGVLAGSYEKTPIGIHIDYKTRNGPFFSTLPFVTGYFLSRFTISKNWLIYGFLVLLLGTIAHFTEIYILTQFFDSSPIQDYVLGTYFMGAGVAIISLYDHPMLRSQRFNHVGQMSLGIYAIHFLYVDLFREIDKSLNSPFWEVGYVLIVLLLSVLSCIALSKNRITEKIVR